MCEDYLIRTIADTAVFLCSSTGVVGFFFVGLYLFLRAATSLESNKE